MTAAQEIILLFTKYPQPGNSKTRLIPALGPDGAADLQRAMTLSICEKIKDIAAKRPCHTRIYYTGCSVGEIKNLLGKSFSYQQQQRGNLGQRMCAAISQHLGKYHAIILVGADCPAVDGDILLDGMEKLRDSHAVIGPAFDGGYYLIGVRGDVAKSSLAHIFSNISWGSAKVCEQTLERMTTLNMRYQLLPKLHDIDTPEDLKYLHNHPGTE
ncbi:MAG: TIGR04282 family arsenosugar biosynthesis glycosyltransferase [Desulfocapsaceae bacterium]|nr:TIGR04282 family arsenosugar biosynthesis glycosyltransferase [Desulfocapsaceae bacterium]